MTIALIVGLVLVFGASVGYFVYKAVKRSKFKSLPVNKKYPDNDWVWSKTYKIYVARSPKTKWVDETLIDAWCQHMLEFWGKHYDVKKLEASFKNRMVFMRDKPYIELSNGGKVNGIAFPKGDNCYIATIPKDPNRQSLEDRVHSLFLHEVSHLILADGAGVPEQKHHDLMRDLKFGH